MEFNAAFQWQCQPQAEALILNILDCAIQKNLFISSLAQDLIKETNTRLFDWLDHVAVNKTDALLLQLEESGFVAEIVTADYRVFHHPGAQLPRIMLYDHDQEIIEIAMMVDRIADFLMVRGISARIEGSFFCGYRRCLVHSNEEVCFYVVERRGTRTMEPAHENENFLEVYFDAVEKWKSRARSLEDEEAAFANAIETTQELVTLLGTNMAAWVILECEREYWQTRNSAAQIQKNRQDRLGLGWANHDHHTFRSSRKYFTKLVRLFEILGFHCRERFYAGKEAGWGAQVMENPECKLVLFLDVDLHEDEIAIDFAHQRLLERESLGTIGLWCALHGDSILKAGMHHLEAQFLFEDLTKGLSELGIGMMNPFSSFSYLKQAFTKGEIWDVQPNKISALLNNSKITSEQADKFLSEGALGSHLENLQRREGYKGFNQKNVSFIIKETDPRNRLP